MAWAATPEYEVPAGVETEIPLDGSGSVLFPDNGRRVVDLLVDVVQSDLDIEGAGAVPEGFDPVSEVVSVVAQDPAGLPVRDVPNEILDPSSTSTADTPAAENFVPGIEISLPVDASAVVGVNPNRIKLFTRSTGDPWQEIPSAYDPDTGRVTGHNDHLSDFAVFAVEAAAAAAAVGPVVVLDPDNDVGFATWGAELTELAQNLKLTSALTAGLERQCKAQVVVTRGDGPDVLPSVRAQIAENASPDLMVTLAFNALEEPGREPGSIWGNENDGGVRAWATSTGDEAFAQRFLDAVPDFTGRPSTLDVQPFDGLVPYPALDAVDVSYAHIEMLFLDHAFDQPVIADRFDLVVDAATAAMVGELEAKGFACDDGGGLPQRPSAGELQTLRNLGWQNHQLYGADPVSFSSGNYVMDEPVLSLSGVGDQVIDFNLVYNSQDDRESIFGIGWSFAYNAAYREYADGGVLIRLEDGRSLVFEPGPNGDFVAPPGSNSTLTRVGGGLVELSSNNTEKHRFQVDPATGIGVLTSTEDRQGNMMNFDWDDPTGSTGLRPLRKVTDEAGQVVTMTATSDGRIASVTHPDGRVWAFTYDNGRLDTLTDARSNVRSFDYTDNGYMATVTAGDGVTYLTNSYDDEGRVLLQENATGDVRRFEYEESRTVYTDGLGNETTYLFNDQGQITETVNAVGDTATTEYDDYNPVTETDEKGRVTRTEYDDEGRPIKITDPIGAVQTMEYNSSGDLIRMEQPDGLGGRRTTTFEIDDQGRVTRTTYDDGSTESATFDEHGDRTSMTDQNGHTTMFELDGRGNTTTITDPIGAVRTATYDLANRLVTRTDENGHTTDFNYDRADNLISETDPLGNKIVYTYDANNKVTSQTDALGRTTTYRYDANLNLVGVDHPDGSPETFIVDAEYGVVSRIDGRGGREQTEFDPLLRPVATVDENGQRWVTEYDEVGNPIKLTSPDGSTVALEYDAMDRVVNRIDQNGQPWSTTFDLAGNRTSDTAPDGTAITAEFDSLGRMTVAVDEEGNRSRAAYDPAGNVESRTDRRGNITTMSYDPLNRLVRTVNPDGGISTQRYDPAGNLVAVTDPRGGVVRTTYDGANRAVVNTDQLGAEDTTKYDAVGNPVLTRDAEGNEVTMAYDAMNRLTVKTSPLGDEDRYHYDANGNLVTLVKPDGVVTRRFYDGRDELIKVVENAVDGVGPSADLNVTTTYERDAVGRLTAMVDANGHRTTYDRDGRGDITRRTDPLQRVTSWSYNPVGTVASRTDGNGNSATYHYFPDRQVERIDYQDGTSIGYGYDADNQSTSMTDELGITTWSRDWRGNETSSTDVNGNTVEHRYDLNGNITELWYSDGFRSIRTYDAADRVASITDPSGTIGYQRDLLGRVTGVSHPGGVTTAIDFDAEGNIVLINHEGPKDKPSATVLRLDYTYTPDDLVATRTMATAKGKDTGKPNDPGNDGPDQTVYSYDGLNRLISTVAQGEADAFYTYDAVGNRMSYVTDADPNTSSPKDDLSVTYSYDDGDQLVTETRSSKNKSTVITRSFDANGNQLSLTAQRLNPKGKPVGKAETTTFGYNQRDQLTLADDQRWARDGSGRAMASVDGKDTTEYVYDDSHIIETTGDDAGLFVRDESQRLLSQTIGKKPTTETLLTDLIGSVLGSVTEKGKSSKIATFTDFGQYVGKQEPVGVFGFAGELQDDDDQRIDFLTRSYDPTVGRFVQRDRVGQDVEKPSSFHPYKYAFAAPTTYTDYLGNFGWSSVKNFVSEHKATIASVAVGVAVGAAVAACIGTVVCGGVALGALATSAAVGATSAVAAGATYRSLDNDPDSRAFDLSSIGLDALVGGIAGPVVSKAGSLVSGGVRSATSRIASTATAQRLAASTAGRAVSTTVSSARATVNRAVQRAAAAARQRSADVSSSIQRTLATTPTRVANGVRSLRARATVSPQSGRTPPSSSVNHGGEFVDDFVTASPGLERVAAGRPSEIPKFVVDADGTATDLHRLFSRTSFRNSSIDDMWEGARPGQTPSLRGCPTCEVEVPRVNAQGRRPWDGDHQPTWGSRATDWYNEWSAGRAELPVRGEVLDNWNQGLRLQCQTCNRSNSFNEP